MTTSYDDMTLDELRAIYTIHFGQSWPDDSLLLRRVLKLNAAIKAATAAQQGYPASEPPQHTGVYLIHDGLNFRICEYDIGKDNGLQWGWIDEVEDEINVVRWWHLPPAPRNSL